jgi:hypothetical protein
MTSGVALILVVGIAGALATEVRPKDDALTTIRWPSEWAAQDTGAGPSTAWLSPWVGTWDTEDTYFPAAGGSTVERGVRTCAFVMRNTYLQCETVVERERTGRVYRFLLNYNATTARFEMLSLWSNVPHKLVQRVTPDEERRRWTFANLAVVGDSDPLSPHWSELVFEAPDRIVWTGRRVQDQTTNPATAPLSFKELWRRRR